MNFTVNGCVYIFEPSPARARLARRQAHLVLEETLNPVILFFVVH
jgi:hypothetical protein